MRFGSVVLLTLLTTLAGCVGLQAPVSAGGRCTRTSECAVGHLCNMGVCTTDRTGFGMGMVPVPPMDAGPVDAFAEPDAFLEGTDAFVEPIDAYVQPGTDAWAPDARAPDPDAFSPPMPDAFVPDMPDAFVSPDGFVEPDAAP